MKERKRKQGRYAEMQKSQARKKKEVGYSPETNMTVLIVHGQIWQKKKFLKWIGPRVWQRTLLCADVYAGIKAHHSRCAGEHIAIDR